AAGAPAIVSPPACGRDAPGCAQPASTFWRRAPAVAGADDHGGELTTRKLGEHAVPRRVPCLGVVRRTDLHHGGGNLRLVTTLGLEERGLLATLGDDCLGRRPVRRRPTIGLPVDQ